MANGRRYARSDSTERLDHWGEAMGRQPRRSTRALLANYKRRGTTPHTITAHRRARSGGSRKVSNPKSSRQFVGPQRADGLVVSSASVRSMRLASELLAEGNIEVIQQCTLKELQDIHRILTGNKIRGRVKPETVRNSIEAFLGMKKNSIAPKKIVVDKDKRNDCYDDDAMAYCEAKKQNRVYKCSLAGPGSVCFTIDGKKAESVQELIKQGVYPSDITSVNYNQGKKYVADYKKNNPKGVTVQNMNACEALKEILVNMCRTRRQPEILTKPFDFVDLDGTGTLGHSNNADSLMSTLELLLETPQLVNPDGFTLVVTFALRDNRGGDAKIMRQLHKKMEMKYQLQKCELISYVTTESGLSDKYFVQCKDISYKGSQSMGCLLFKFTSCGNESDHR